MPRSLRLLNCWQKETATEQTIDSEIEESLAAADEQLEYEDETNKFVNDAKSDSDYKRLIEKKTANNLRKRRQRPDYNSAHSTADNCVECHACKELDAAELELLLATSWFQPQLSSKLAVDRLLMASPGEFLVRRKAAGYELCLRTNNNKVKRFKVVYMQPYYMLKGANKRFQTLRALVTHHSVMAEQLPVTLNLPRNIKEVANPTKTTQLLNTKSRADDLVNLNSLQLAQILKTLHNWEATQ